MLHITPQDPPDSHQTRPQERQLVRFKKASVTPERLASVARVVLPQEQRDICVAPGTQRESFVAPGTVRDGVPHDQNAACNTGKTVETASRKCMAWEGTAGSGTSLQHPEALHSRGSARVWPAL